MKISGLEKCILVLTAAILLFTVGFFTLQRGREDYVLRDQTLRTEKAASSAAGSKTTNDGKQRVNINTADAAQLQSLPGIGETKALAIIADRKANGRFRYPEELTRVPGIGEGTLEKILDYITVE